MRPNSTAIRMQPVRVTLLCRDLILLGLALAGVSCNLPAAYAYPGQARQALVSFFEELSNGQYGQAAELYGGDYAQLQVLGPDTERADRAALWQNACEKGGMQCLPIATAYYLGSAGSTYTFTVEFRKPDGNLFAVAPCCGEPGFMNRPMDDFVYRVKQMPGGEFLVLDPPVSIP